MSRLRTHPRWHAAPTIGRGGARNRLDRSPADPAAGDRCRAGFTLVELLVTIAVIAMLIGILMPAIGRVRDAARGAACLGNHRQFGIAWNSYLVDRIYVPFVRKDGGVEHVKYWGVVDWYDKVSTTSLSAVNKFWNERPLNTYLGADVHQTKKSSAFLCPADTGLTYRNKDGLTEPYWSDDAAQAVSNSDLRDDTIFGVRGSSYTANDWLWVKPGQYNGFGARDSSRSANDPFRYEGFTNRNQLSTVSSPSHLIIVSDADDAEAWRVRASFRHWSSSDHRPAGMPYGAWHGYEKTNASFLDGSARNIRIEADAGATSDYTFWLQPELHGPGSATIASKSRLSTVPGG